MLYRIDEEISNQTLDSLINVINDLQPFEELDLYIRGTGGELGVTDAMLRIVNKCSLTNIVNLYVYEYIMSSHFHFFFKCKAHTKTLSSQSYGMIHKGEWKSSSVEGGHVRQDEYNIFMREYFKQADSLKELLKVVKLNPNEIKKFKNNQDVYILPDRMNELLEYNLTKTKAKPIKIKLNEDNQIELNLA